MSNKIALLFAILVAYVACVQTQPPRQHHLVQSKRRLIPRSARFLYIVGMEIDILDVPYQVSLLYFGCHFCGGAVLSKKWITTAAHCTKEKQLQHLRVRLGSSEYAFGGTVVQIKRIVEHPLYDTVDYDFSLMELETELTFSDVIQPVPLPEHDDPVKAGTMATVSGWGAKNNAAELNDALRAVDVPIVCPDVCRYAYSLETITDRMMCAGYKRGGKITCHTDSGDPLVTDGKLVGVVSRSIGCALAETPGIYGHVASVREWIRKNSGV